MCFLKEFSLENNYLPQNQIYPNSFSSGMKKIIESDYFYNPFSTFGPSEQGFNIDFERNFNFISAKLIENEKQIISLQNKIDDSLQKIQELGSEIEICAQNCIETKEVVKVENFHQQLSTFQKTQIPQTLSQKLFGKRDYAYRMVLDEEFPSQLLKQRNFSFSLKLSSLNQSLIKNSNPIKLVLGVCDNDGNWITSCSNGQDFMKGNKEIQICHGQGEFRKIYPRDISRPFRDHKINFVIYPQPSQIKYIDSINQFEIYVQPMQIEPLIIEGIEVRAKRVQKKPTE